MASGDESSHAKCEMLEAIDRAGARTPATSSATLRWLERFGQRQATQGALHRGAAGGKVMSQWRLQEALRKAAADLPDKPKVSDAVFSKILLLMKWKRTAKEQADARPCTMAARRTRLQRLRALTARMSAVQGAGFINNGEELGVLVDIALEKEVAELQERMLAAEEHKSKGFTSPSDIQRRMRVAMQGVRLWRTSSVGNGIDDSWDSSSGGDTAGASAEGHLQQPTGAPGPEALQQPAADERHCGSGQQRAPSTPAEGDSCGSGGWTTAAGSGGSSASIRQQLPISGLEDAWALGPEFAALLMSTAEVDDPAGLELHAGSRVPDPTAGHAGLMASGGGGGGTLANLTAAGSLLRSLPSQRMGSRRFLHMQSMNRSISSDAVDQLDPLSSEQQAGQQRRRAGLLGDADQQLSAASANAAGSRHHSIAESVLSLDSAAGVRLLPMLAGGAGSGSTSLFPATTAATAAGGNALHGATGSLQRLLSRSGSNFATQQRLLVRQSTFQDDAAESALLSALGVGVHGSGTEAASAAGLCDGSAEAEVADAAGSSAAGAGVPTAGGTPTAAAGAKLSGVPNTRAPGNICKGGTATTATNSQSAPVASSAAAHVRWQTTGMTGDSDGGVSEAEDVAAMGAEAAVMGRAGHRSPSHMGGHSRSRAIKMGSTGTCSSSHVPRSRSPCSSSPCGGPVPQQSQQPATVSHLTFSWGCGLVSSAPSAAAAADSPQQGRHSPHPGLLQSTSRKNLVGRNSPCPAARGSLARSSNNNSPQQQPLPALLTSPTAAGRMAGVGAVRRFVSASLDSATAGPFGRGGGCSSPTPSPSQQPLYSLQLQSHQQPQQQLQQALLQYGRAVSPGPLAARHSPAQQPGHLVQPAAAGHSVGAGFVPDSTGSRASRISMAPGIVHGGGLHLAPAAVRVSPLPFGGSASGSASPVLGERGDGARSPFVKSACGPR